MVRQAAVLRTLPREKAQTLIVESDRAALGLDVAAAFLAFDPALFRSERRLGRTTRRRPDRRLAQEFEQPICCVGAGGLLGAGGARAAAGIEAQLGCGRQLVDVLATGTGGANERDIDVVLVDGEVTGDPQHGGTGAG